MMDVQCSQAVRGRVICAPEQDDMNEGHPRQQWYDTAGHDNVFAKQPLGANVATTDADEDDGQGEAGTPP